MQISPRDKKRIAVCAITLAFSLCAYAYGFFDSWQNALSDRFFIRSPQPRDIVIVAVDDAGLAEIGQWPWQRSVFAQAIDNLQNARAIGIDVVFSEPSSGGSADDLALAGSIRESRVPLILPVELRPNGTVSANVLPALRDSVSPERIGFINIRNGVDGITRSVDSTRASSQGILKSFSSALVQASPESASLPTPPENFRISFRGPSATFLTVSLTDLIHGRLPMRIFDDAYVLIGATAVTLRDSVKTPFGAMPGVEVHANAASTILEGRYLNDASLPTGIILLIISGMSAALLVIRIRRFGLLAGIFSAFAFLLIIASAVSFSGGIILPLLYLLIGAFLMFGSMLAFEYVSESREKQFIEQSFQHYLSADVINELIRNPGKLSLGGERKKVTILFSDIRGFTTLSESLTPEELVSVMNEYLTVMTDIIMAHGGLVDKYIGDAIMAFWGAPLPNPHQAENAAHAANAMAHALAKLNEDFQSRGLPEIGIGIGLNSGEVIVGNMGSKRRFNYTIMGDEVNFASRLEGLNKMYGTSCVISEATYLSLQHAHAGVLPEGARMRRLDTVAVKGKSEPRVIYELLSSPFQSGLDPDSHDESRLDRRLGLFEEGRRSYEKGDWDAAIAIFKEVLDSGEDGPAEALLGRCIEFKKNPPPAWNGVHAFHSK